MVVLHLLGEIYFVGGDGLYGAAAKEGNHAILAFPDSLDRLTICILVLHNGFTVIGTSACVSAENFNADLGKKIARQNATNQLWPLLGFNLAAKLYESEKLLGEAL